MADFTDSLTDKHIAFHDGDPDLPFGSGRPARRQGSAVSLALVAPVLGLSATGGWAAALVARQWSNRPDSKAPDDD